MSLRQTLRGMALKELFTGMTVTLRHMFKPNITIQYPEQRTHISPRFRGEHALMKYKSGRERCVACKLCEAVCPAQAIYIEIDAESQGQRRCTSVYDIDNGKCIFCGYCQEACPVDAIVLGPNFEMVAETREGLLSDKEKLLGNGVKWNDQINANLKADAKYR
ncbi:MAG: NADH-quinone oxidoreductase subunit NuoI [Magnetococcales bacterium]|nr:NADH-quinone oxidoreductase subunit NuoI [Magnetococcales bacterium]